MKLFDLTDKVPDHNGLEVLRKINNEMDAIPENASDLLALNFGNCIADKDGRIAPCKDLKETHTIIETIDDAALAHKKICGDPPLAQTGSHGSRGIVWSPVFRGG